MTSAGHSEGEGTVPTIGGDARRLRAVLNASRLLIVVVDEDGLVREVNRAVERATGRPAEASLRPLWDLAALPAERSLLRAAFTPFRPEALPPSLLFHLDAATGASRVVDWNVEVLTDCDEPLVVLSGIDVSDRIAAEQHLREAEAFQRQILARLPAIVWATDKDLRFTFSAGGSLASLGLGFGEVAAAGTSLYGYFHTNDPTHPAIAPHVKALQGEATPFEIKWLDRRFQARVEPFRDRNDNLLGTIGLAFDVTEQARTAKALELSESRLRRLVDANVIGICFWDEQGRLNDANESFLQLVGATREELQDGALSWRELTPPDNWALDERALEQLRTSGRCTPYEKAFRAKDGAWVPVLIGGAALEQNGGGLQGVSFIVDLREQVRLRNARDQLLQQEQGARMETELANARLMLLVEGSRRLARTRNPSETLETLAAVVVPALADWSFVVHRGWAGGPALAASAHGDPNKEALLRSLHGCGPDLAAPEGAAKAFRTGEVVQYDDVQPEQLLPGPSGWPLVGTQDPAHLHTIRELGVRSLLCVPIAGRSGVDAVIILVSAFNPHRYGPDDVFLARDLADRASVSLENGRLLFEALDAVRARNEFLAVAAHELRTPLASGLLKVQLIKRALDKGEPSSVAAARGMAADAESQVRRLSTLIDALLEVVHLTSHRLWLQIEDVELCALVKDVLAKTAPDLQRAGCALTVAMPDAVWGRWDRARLEQVLTSLLANAMKFGAGSPIAIAVRAAESTVEISVRDQGIGISKEDQARIFERFERAVSPHHFGGLGLGLYLTVQIVRAHQGRLRVESEPGRGACFTIDLPRRPRQA